MSGRDKFKKNKKIIILFCKVLNVFSKKFQYKLYSKFNHGESKFKILFRYCILKNICKKIGDNVYIGSDVTIKNYENLSIGENVSIHKNSYLDALGEIVIGDNVSIATDSKIISFNHTWNDVSIPIKYNELSLQKIEISDDVWIGAGAIVLAGNKIGNRVVVGALSVVTKNLESNSVYAGNPARLLKKIGEDK